MPGPNSCSKSLLLLVVAAMLSVASLRADICDYPSTASIAYSGPDEYGHGTVTITYSFGTPPGATPGGRVTLNAEGPGGVLYVTYIDVNQQSGIWSFPFNVTCWAAGSYKFTGIASGCGDSATSSTQVSVPDGTPSVSMSYSPDQYGHGTWTIHYRLPNTDSPGQRQVTRIVEGPGWTSFDTIHPSDIEGDWVFPYNVTCFKSGTYTFKSHVQSCLGSKE